MTTPVDETFAYDDDGNLTQDGSITYTWDAENRLASAAPTAPVSGSKKLEFVYDYRGRRVQKQVSTYNGSTWSLTSTERYVYDAWNVVLTLDGNNAVTRKLTWGLDLSGTLQGAGGIGGLLAAKVGSSNYWYFYDGNGNVTQVVSPPGGIGIMIPQPPDGVQAHYEYDPYGNILASTGNFAAANPFRFSTKWCDTETGLYYYGYRYYSTRIGRWLSADWDEAEVSLNPYSYASNDPGDGGGMALELAIGDTETLFALAQAGALSAAPPGPRPGWTPVELPDGTYGGPAYYYPGYRGSPSPPPSYMPPGYPGSRGQGFPRPRGHLVLHVNVSFYCSCKLCCGPKASGICADGTRACKGTLAADWSVFPKGSIIRIILPDGTVIDGSVHDKGGAIKGNKLDVWCASHRAAIKNGRFRDARAVVILPR